MRILIIEDSDSIRRMMEALFSGRGFVVTSVENGAKGLEVATTETPDAILLDLNLPGPYDGYAVCERLRANAPTRGVPIVVISATSDGDLQDRAIAAGATAFYTKPFSPTALLKEVEAVRTRARSSASMRVAAAARDPEPDPDRGT